MKMPAALYLVIELLKLPHRRKKMEKSKHNIFSQIKDSRQYFIINPLSKNADILSPDLAREYETDSFSDPEIWVEKGYLVDPEKEAIIFKNAYLDFIDQRDKDEVQLFFVPTYSCNFACTYCYQEGYDPHNEPFRQELVDAFFKYIDKEFAGRRKYITIFGGEPLLPGEGTKKTIEHILKEADKRQLDVAIVTNGFHLNEYIPMLKNRRIRELQVTLDGTYEAHDKRRSHKGGEPSFIRITKGINTALKAGLPINLRMVLDKENIEELPILAQFAIDQGWTESSLFKTQLGRNYELHFCQKGPSKLYSRVSMYEDIYKLVKGNPHILKFHKPAYSISKFLWENGDLPEPLFDSCPGTKTEWAFDHTGHIYSCTATVGKQGESLGTYYPEVTRGDEIIEEWEERDVTTIPECKDCSQSLSCGGGCASVAKNKTGRILAPDCRPVKELLEMGIALYFDTVNEE